MRAPTSEALSHVAADTSDRHLVVRAQRGDEAAFAEIFERHKRRVYSLCLRLTHAPADAEDLTQDVFLLLFRKISTFRGESAFSTWLYRMVTNIALMHLRKKSHPQVSLDDLGPTHNEPARREVGDRDLRLQGCVDRITLEQAIAKLPPGYRAVYALYELHGYGHREIAEIMNWSVGNSKSQLHKARRKLRAAISHRWSAVRTPGSASASRDGQATGRSRDTNPEIRVPIMAKPISACAKPASVCPA